MTSEKIDGPLLNESFLIVSGTYYVKVQLMMGDLDGGGGEYVDTIINGNTIGNRCTPTSCTPYVSHKCPGSCQSYDCSVNYRRPEFTTSISTVEVSLQYGNGYNWSISGNCQVNGSNATAAAHVTLISKGTFYYIILSYVIIIIKCTKNV